MTKPRKVNYKVLPRKSNDQTVQDAYAMLDQLVSQHHPDLEEATIVLAWQFDCPPDKDGHIMLGKCRKAGELDRQLHGADFVIVLNREVWIKPEWTDEHRKAMLDHELCHCAPVLEDGEQKEDENGHACWRVRKHDIEEFHAVIERHGCYKADLETFAETLLEKGRRPLLADQEDVPTITVNMDRRCKQCGKKGCTGSGYCLKCAADQIMAEVEQEICPK